MDEDDIAAGHGRKGEDMGFQWDIYEKISFSLGKEDRSGILI